MKRRLLLLASTLLLPVAARADDWQTIVAPDLKFRL